MNWVVGCGLTGSRGVAPAAAGACAPCCPGAGEAGEAASITTIAQVRAMVASSVRIISTPPRTRREPTALRQAHPAAAYRHQTSLESASSARESALRWDTWLPRRQALVRCRYHARPIRDRRRTLVLRRLL